tara:strand:- start:111 stop:1373 length:1263 start_codon:yes stop_codon:yes gene_type:complete
MSLLKNCPILLICLSIQLNSFGIAFENKIFKKNIHTVILTNEESQTTFPLINLNDGKQLTLRFDDISNEVKDYSYTLIHCDDQWNQSDIFPNDYLEGFEEEQITTYDYSINTAVDYIHYSISFPNNNIKPTQSGNYILLVFDNFDRADVVLTQKLFIAETKVDIKPQPTTPVDFDHRYTHQEIDFKVNYTIFPIDDPFNEIRVVILQNNRYDNALSNLKPKFVKDKELIYNFEAETVFEGGNEYRVFDNRDLNIGGLGVEEIIYLDSIYHTVLTVDHKRAFTKYTTQFDHNGNYYIGAKINKSPYTEADYSHVHFRLPYPKELATGNVYLNGGFTGNELKLDARMLYRDSLQRYEASILLKQGVYDYSYLFREGNSKKGNWETLEGTFYQTENIYTVLVYHKGFSDNAQKLIGVKRFIYQ